MQSPDQTNAHLDKNLEVYRSAVKAFSRHSLVLALIAIVSLNLSLAYVDLVSKRQIPQEELDSVVMQQNTLNSAREKTEKLAADIGAEREAIIKYARSCAGQLADNWQRFLNTAQTPSVGTRSVLQGRDERPALRERLRPANAPVGTTNAPVSLTDDSIRDALLRGRYQLTDEQIKIVTKKGATEKNAFLSDEAFQIGKQVFLGEIERTYEQLNSEIDKRYRRLRKHTQAQLAELNPLTTAAGIKPFPPAEVLIPQPAKIPAPTDISLFRTVSAKELALETDAMVNTVDLDAARTPLEAIGKQLEQVQESTRIYREQILAGIKETEDQINDLDEQIQAIQQQIRDLLKYLKILPLRTETFVRVSPCIAAAVLLLLASRFSKLYRLRRRLRNDCLAAGMTPQDTNLSLSVPDCLLEWVGGFGPGPFALVSIAHLILPVAIAVVIAWAADKIYAWPVEETTLQLANAYHKTAYAIMITACALAYLPLLLRVCRKRT
ncbi:MAG: hypothetical protein ACYS14_11580 [Planctomycetota bacterium]|jgi:hypothetical protein